MGIWHPSQPSSAKWVEPPRYGALPVGAPQLGLRGGMQISPYGTSIKKGDLTVRSPFSFAACIYLANGRLAEFRKAYIDAKKRILGVNGAIAACQRGLAHRF